MNSYSWFLHPFCVDVLVISAGSLALRHNINNNTSKTASPASAGRWEDKRCAGCLGLRPGSTLRVLNTRTRAPSSSLHVLGIGSTIRQDSARRTAPSHRIFVEPEHSHTAPPVVT